jgi:hypothetical protein
VDVAIGCRDHSGWAVMVGIGGDPSAPQVVARERVELVDEALPRMAYHAALEVDLDEAAKLIAEVERSAEAFAERSLATMVEQLHRDGHHVVGVAVAASSSPPPAELAKVLASHSFVHAAEGELYRDALAEASARLGLPLTRYANKHAIGEAAAALGVDTEALGARVASLRKVVGPPWQKDHREATAAALLVLSL